MSRSSIFIASLLVFAAVQARAQKDILADTETLKALNIKIIESDKDLNVGRARVTEADLIRISKYSHEKGRCAGFQVLEEKKIPTALSKFKPMKIREQKYLMKAKAQITKADSNIKDAIKEVSDQKISDWISWLSGFGGRYHAAANPNIHTAALAERLRNMVAGVGYPTQVELVQHRRTKQNSVRLRLVGAKRPSEIIVLGGHLDSVNWSMGGINTAPGADDNASGSAALLEALRVILMQGQPERTIEFMWYAAEEVGLYGSTEIADEYEAQKKDVIAVLQLDMTLHPGSGANVISSVSDFTSGWLRDMLVEFNNNYLNIKIIDDKCGYACSDHAPWFNNGYPTLMPFESHTDKMNGRIHTPQDAVNSASSMHHAAIFSKIAVIYGMTLANSDLRAP